MTAVEVLRKARALYEANPSHAEPADWPERGCVCLVTAVEEACNDKFSVADKAHAALRQVTGSERLVAWNYEHSTEEVLAAFDRAIEASS